MFKWRFTNGDSSTTPVWFMVRMCRLVGGLCQTEGGLPQSRGACHLALQLFTLAKAQIKVDRQVGVFYLALFVFCVLHCDFIVLWFSSTPRYLWRYGLAPCWLEGVCFPRDPTNEVLFCFCVIHAVHRCLQSMRHLLMLLYVTCKFAHFNAISLVPPPSHF